MTYRDQINLVPEGDLRGPKFWSLNILTFWDQIFGPRNFSSETKIFLVSESLVAEDSFSCSGGISETTTVFVENRHGILYKTVR